jgi:hypothetical protein
MCFVALEAAIQNPTSLAQVQLIIVVVIPEVRGVAHEDVHLKFQFGDKGFFGVFQPRLPFEDGELKLATAR